jgi:hypothetical protein
MRISQPTGRRDSNLCVGLELFRKCASESDAALLTPDDAFCAIAPTFRMIAFSREVIGSAAALGRAFGAKT